MKETNYAVYMIKLNEVVMYVGKTSDFKRRKREHLNEIGTTSHSAIPIGTDLSKVTIIKVKEFSDKDEALRLEGELILQYDTVNNGWNKQRSGLICVEDKKAYDKKYRDEHKEEYKAYRKKWRKEHREECNAYERERYHKSKLNKEENVTHNIIG